MSTPFDQGVSAFWSASVSAFWSGCLQPFDQQVTLTSKTYVWVSPHFDQGVITYWSQCLQWSASETDFKNLSSNFHWGVVSTFWSASDTDFKNLSLGVHLLIRVSPPLGDTLKHLFHQGVSTFWSGCDFVSSFHQDVSAFWSASDTDFKNLSSNFQEGELSPPFDQQVTHWLQKPKFGCLLPFDQGVSDLWVSPAFWSGCLHLLISKWHWLQKPKFQLSLVGCLHLLISKWQWLQKPKFGHSTFWSGLSPPFDQQVTLTWHHVWVSPSLGVTLVSASFHQGVSAFWSASDTDFKNLSLGVSTFWSASDTDFKNLSLGVSLLIRVSLPLGVFTSFDQGVSAFWSASDTDFKNLSSNFHWHRLSPPFDQQVTLTWKTYVWVSTPFDWCVSTFGCLHFFIRVSLPFDQQVTLTSKT